VRDHHRFLFGVKGIRRKLGRQIERGLAMRKALLPSIFATMFTAVVAFADPQSPPPSPPAPAAATQPPDTKSAVICEDRVATGSRLAYARDCHTQAEWEVIRRAARDYLDITRRKSLNSNQMPGGTGK
jgi:hypothetical protein